MSAGKGDAPRNCFSAAFRRNYARIRGFGGRKRRLRLRELAEKDLKQHLRDEVENVKD